MTTTETYVVLLFADLAGFTALTETHGDLDAAEIAEQFYALATMALAGEARLVKTMGDAVMLVAPDPAAGVAVARRLLAAVEQRSGFPAVRIGLHYGPAVERAGDFFGATVNLAARVTAHARAGQIIGTEAVAQALTGRPGLQIAALGHVQFKNVAQATPLFLIEDPLLRSETLALDPVCRMRLDPHIAPARLPWGEQIYVFCSLACAQAFLHDPDAYTTVT